MVCSSDTANVEQSKEKIITAFATMKLQNNTLANVRRNLIRRAQLRARPRGRRFQRFFKLKRNWRRADILCPRVPTLATFTNVGRDNNEIRRVES